MVWTWVALAAGLILFFGTVSYLLRRSERHGTFERKKGPGVSFHWPGDGPHIG